MYRQAFWMAHFDHFSVKRTILWSTSPSIIAFLHFSTLRGKKGNAAKPTAAKYINRYGEVAYQGTKHLKKSQCHGCY